MANTEKLDQFFADYEAFHRTKGNKVTHYFGIPMIVFSTFGILTAAGLSIESFFGIAMMILILIFYVSLQLFWGSLFSILLGGLFWLSRFVSVEVHVILFILGWILQGVGHYKYEKQSPAFLKNLTHLMIGPFWIFHRFVRA